MDEQRWRLEAIADDPKSVERGFADDPVLPAAPEEIVVPASDLEVLGDLEAADGVADAARDRRLADKRNPVRTAERDRNRVNLRFNIFVFADRLRDFRSLLHRNDVGKINAFGQIFIADHSGAASTIPSRIQRRRPKTSSSYATRKKRSRSNGRSERSG